MKAAVKKEPVCSRCGRGLSHPHYALGDDSVAFCTWFCGKMHHAATGAGIYRLDHEQKQVVIIEPRVEEKVEDEKKEVNGAARAAQEVKQETE